MAAVGETGGCKEQGWPGGRGAPGLHGMEWRKVGETVSAERQRFLVKRQGAEPQALHVVTTVSFNQSRTARTSAHAIFSGVATT